jgi:hypothetical protein
METQAQQLTFWTRLLVLFAPIIGAWILVRLIDWLSGYSKLR